MFSLFSFRMIMLFYWFFVIITEEISLPFSVIVMFIRHVMSLCGVGRPPLAIAGFVVFLKEPNLCLIRCAPLCFPLVGTQYTLPLWSFQSNFCGWGWVAKCVGVFRFWISDCNFRFEMHFRIQKKLLDREFVCAFFFYSPLPLTS